MRSGVSAISLELLMSAKAVNRFFSAFPTEKKNFILQSFAVLTAATKKKDGRWFNFVRDEEIEREFEMGEDDAVILA